ncbi:MAG: hypothetical protein MJ214_04290 [Bacilli bacterium]|nr:hypothetical protein [Bacilli bacterium]
MKKIKLLVTPLLSVAFLVSCGKNPEPTIKHTLTFSGENCDLYLDVEGKTKYTTTQFDAGYTFSGYVIASEGCSLPTEVTFTSDGKPYEAETATYNSTTGSLSVKMNANIDVTAISKPTDYTVTQEEFDAALAFTGVEYLQTEATANTPKFMEGTEIEQMSPTTYYVNRDATIMGYHSTSEEYVYELDKDTYKKISRESPETSWDDVSWEDATEEDDWITPQVVGGELKSLLIASEVEFDPDKYNPATKTYVLSGSFGTSCTFKFEDKKLVYLDVAEMITSTTTTTSFTYKVMTPKLPIAPPKPIDPTVTKDEFNAALAFTGIEYLQCESSINNNHETKKCSPNIYHYIKEDASSNYYEAYVYKLDDKTYKKISRESPETSWDDASWEEATEADDWENPQYVGKVISTLLNDIGVEDFDPSKYDPDTKSYILKTGAGADVIFKFEDKKLVYLDLGKSDKISFTYKQETPELPIPEPVNPVVTSEEYDAALAFTGVEYLQVNTDTDTVTKTQVISPSTYHVISSDYGTYYDEKYAYELDATNHEYIERKESTASWKEATWTPSEEEWITPQKEGASIKAKLAELGVEGFKSFTYDPTSESYVHNLSGGGTLILQFANKKLVYMNRADSEEATFEYKKITPVTPINPPIEPLEGYTLKFYENDETTEFLTTTIVVDETSEYYSITFPQHGTDEGGWYCVELYGQTFYPGSTIEMPPGSLGDYNFVWTPETI